MTIWVLIHDELYIVPAGIRVQRLIRLTAPTFGRPSRQPCRRDSTRDACRHDTIFIHHGRDDDRRMGRGTYSWSWLVAHASSRRRVLSSSTTRPCRRPLPRRSRAWRVCLPAQSAEPRRASLMAGLGRGLGSLAWRLSAPAPLLRQRVCHHIIAQRGPELRVPARGLDHGLRAVDHVGHRRGLAPSRHHRHG